MLSLDRKFHSTTSELHNTTGVLHNTTPLKVFCLLLNIPIGWALTNLFLWLGSRIPFVWNHLQLILWPSVIIAGMLISYLVLRFFKVDSRRMILASFVGICICYFMAALFTYFELAPVPLDILTK